MSYLNKVIYLTEEQKNTLFTNDTITVNGITVNYNSNDLYITPEEIDTAPTENSTNLITSGGVYNAIHNYVPPLATKATKLATPRSLKVKLNSTTAITFDGSANQEAIPVTGTLPVANGGTGATTFTSGAALIGNGTGAITTRGIRNNTSIGHLGWTSATTDITLVTTNTLAYWNGAYANTSSNLKYSVNGEIMGLSTAQTVSGTKTFSAIQKFTNTTDSTHSKDTAAAISTSGGISVEKQLSAKSIRIDNNQASVGVQLIFNTTTNALNFVFA